MDINFLNGIYSVKTDLILSDDDYNTLKKIDKSLFFKYLKTKDYGFKSNYKKFDNLIESEIASVKLELSSFEKMDLLMAIFYIEHDLINIKIVYKNVKYNIENNHFDVLGNLKFDAIFQAFKNDNFGLLPEFIRKLFMKFNEIKPSNIQNELQEIEKLTYDFYTNYLRAKKDDFSKMLLEFFEYEKAISNLRTFLRLRKRKLESQNLKNALLNENIVGISNWVDAYDLGDYQFIDKISSYFSLYLIDAVSIFLKNNNAYLLEKTLLKYLSEKTLELSYAETGGIILHYLHLKKEESFMLRELYYEK